ncbi:sulfur oxidation c-type cytochrome SoxX [Manganibacter manganicus]|uniref:Sulfur oxidation c-type cytochrome SoxX n=1 Tax=Manganibacter manganicus TaxID=1873176 RepID=A0A1V8RK23_9HYPH|nr:sulfur oxidation c-type cytochrome SoxX [Pseudaminobacter manganicus]OQM73550.1 sulfur oxidation c-type cytochrome SoxX [Pseudaminobacter manganicus]
MNLAGILVAASAAAMCGSVAFAAEIAPTDVKFEDYAVNASLTGVAGNAEEGAKVFADRKLGNCLACHENKAMPKQLFQGNVGPSLDGVADRWSPAQLRAIVSDSKKVFGPETVMPGFYSLEVGINVRKDLVGKTVLSAQQVEDVVAYLATLKE